MRVFRTRIVSIVLTVLLCCTPELLFAVAGQNPSQNNQSAAPSDSTPQQPALTTDALPDAPQAQSQQNAPAQTNATAGQNSATAPQQPEGTAAARGARTIGGPASKPAGSAIAPAKQRQIRSLLIKLGAIAGAGAALGTVYALTRGTSSKPPGAH